MTTTFKSYAQNFEDIILWRALKDVDQGRYVDIGAQHPIVDSVSKAFYERGWRGTHVEPVPEYAEMLRRERPDETVLQVALSDREGPIVLHLISGSGLSTGITEYARAHTNRGFTQQTVVVQALPLKVALASLSDQPIHWLKIDVEGMEAQVLRGWDSTQLRPWIILVEATAPLSQEATHGNWEHLLFDAGYLFAYFDGLNRFYVAKEHANRIDALRIPPNVFDNAELSGLSGPWCKGLNSSLQAAETKSAELAEARLSLEHELANALDRLATQNRRLAHSEAKLVGSESTKAAALRLAARAEQETALATRQVEAMLASSSWRVTAPLRWAGHPFRRVTSAFREGRIRSGLRRRVIWLARQAAKVVGQHAWLKRVALFGLRFSPSLKARLQDRLALTSGSASHAGRGNRPLTPSAANIFRQLESLIPANRRK